MKCDIAMRRSKERASRENPHVEQWKCTKNCARCICGMKYEKHSGAWVHCTPSTTDPIKTAILKSGGNND